MASRIRDLFNRWHLSKVQDRWSAAREAIAELEPFQIHALRAEARALRRRVDRVIHVADHRLAVPFPGAGLPRAPLGTDWAWRPDAWCGPLSAPGIVAADPRNPISGDLALYHDCPLGEVSVRQIRNRAEADRAPFGLAIEVFGFRGSFLSLAVTLPEAAIQGLRSRHLIRLDAVLEAERPQRAFARLNVKHGPNVAQLVQEFPAEGRDKLAEFDLAYAKINETRIERAWLDIIFNDPAQTRIILRDVVLGRRPRAEA
jgi:Family of unknown function (DUF6478)